MVSNERTECDNHIFIYKRLVVKYDKGRSPRFHPKDLANPGENVINTKEFSLSHRGAWGWISLASEPFNLRLSQNQD